MELSSSTGWGEWASSCAATLAGLQPVSSLHLHPGCPCLVELLTFHSVGLVHTTFCTKIIIQGLALHLCMTITVANSKAMPGCLALQRQLLYC